MQGRRGGWEVFGRGGLIILSLLVGGTAYGQATRPSGILMNPHRPTMLGDGCLISRLQLRIRTGNDDLRGGGNNLNIEVHLADGTVQFANNVNHNANWPNNSLNVVEIPLQQPIPPGNVRQLRLIHLAQGGFKPALTPSPGQPLDPVLSAAAGVKTEDNWDMAEVQASGIGNNGYSSIPIASFGPHRFTGSQPSLDINARHDIACSGAGEVTALNFTFRTGNDDLRGGHDNLNIAIHFANGTSQAETNANQSQRWADGTTHQVSVVLNQPVTIDQIKSATLETTFTGGSGGDNWNMDSVDIAAFVDGKLQHVGTSGFHRFSADWTGPKAKTLTVPIK